MASPDDDARADVWAPPDRDAVPASPPPPGQAGWSQPPTGQQPPPEWGQPPTGQQPPPGQYPAPWGQQPTAPPGWAPHPGWGQPPGWDQPPGWAPQPQPWGWAPPPPDPRAQRRKRLIAFGSLGAVVLLLVALVGGVLIAEERREARIRAELERVVPGLQSFVAQQRGLPFQEDVDVEVLDDDEFLDALYAEPEGQAPADDHDPEPTLKALGLLEDDADLDAEVEESLDDGVVGFYDPTTDQLVVRGRDVGPFVQLVLVHELTHALQDQHFDIDRPELDERDDEQSTAFTALLEGDATIVESAWIGAQPLEVQRELEQQLGGESDVADIGIVEELLGFPYYAGPRYVSQLLEQGGQQALDAAFAQPPTTTEQILFPQRAEPPQQPPRPEPGGDVLDEGVLGSLGLSLLLDQDLVHGDVPPDLWDGDRYVTYESGDGAACTVAHIAAPSAAELTAALTAWAQTQGGATVGPGPDGTVRLQACG